MPPDRNPWITGLLTGAVLATTSVILFVLFSSSGGETPGTTLAGSTSTTTGDGSTSSTEPSTTATTGGDTTEATTSTTTTTTVPLDPWVDRRTVGQPWGDAVDGLLTFRGNPTNTWYGTGPIPETVPTRLWRYPDSPMCSDSTDLGTTSRWCGNGWTGQPVIWERPDGVTEMIFGAYDRRLHFVDADTGEDTRSSVLTGDIIKGTPTIDPDGYPLVYFGSRDNFYRIMALDRGDAVELWKAEANLAVEGRWNDDWDASGRIVNDILFEGAENGLFYIWKLNRGYDAQGKVTVDPELLFKMESYDDELLAAIGPSYPAVSVEDSAALFEGVVYFANSGGRILGLDITDVENGNAPIVFDYWVGDDVDSAIVIDDEGMLYVSAQYERYLQRARDLGQVIKLDPSKPDDPYVWGMYSLTNSPCKGGTWTTPALGDGVVYTVTNKGYLVAIDQETGEELWVDDIDDGSGCYAAPHHMSSPVIVDGHLILALVDGRIRNYDLADPAAPELVWEMQLTSGRIEATPAVWDGRIYVAAWDGYMYAVGAG
ncbi:MAG: PQQ-binding-like beta-propeller repeat protein [Actinobacteria bacterium]|nr:PQQ-binding-like beta-propeller repeat protein [Actinomycetota bacterium]